jgi:hypothetical protein
MINNNNTAYSVTVPTASVATNATQTLTFSKVGNSNEVFDRAVVSVNIGTVATNSAVFNTCKISESDDTVATNFSDVVALTGATATSTAAGFVFPTGSQIEGGGKAVEFQIDLSKRKKYLKLQVTPLQKAAPMYSEAALFRASESADTTTDKKIENLAATNAVGCAKIVAG